MNKHIKSKIAEMTDLTVVIIIAIVLMIIGFAIFFSKANSFKSILGY